MENVIVRFPQDPITSIQNLVEIAWEFEVD